MMKYMALMLVVATPSAFAFGLSNTFSFGLEPSSAALLAGGIVGLLAMRRQER